MNASLCCQDGRAAAGFGGRPPPHAQLEQLQEKHAGRGFSVIGCPCSQFGKQEPGSAEEIKRCCSATYGVTFPMTEKIEVNGPGRYPIYQELTQVPDAGGHKGDIRWNLEEFLVSADGERITRFNPQVKPDAPEVIAEIERALPG